VLACSAALVYIVLSAIFPGKTERIEVPEEPERTGDEEIDALLAEGEKAVVEMRRLRDSISGETVRQKIDEIISVTDKIFKLLLEDRGAFKQVKRFADFYLPTTIKLLNTYDRFSQSGTLGENISGTMERIDTALDSIIESYRKFFDSLFEHKALDIETDIKVLESMLKKEGLLNSKFVI
jgi:5-bromo-4-chloroindolyl phosphate hydrolysis protein